MTNITTFKQLGVIDPILQVCNEERYYQPTEIQLKSIPYVIDGKDVIGEAATGSGKTLAFASGIIQHSTRGKGVQALVITPTRELAHQVADMIGELSKYKPLRIIAIYGGVSINPQIRDLKRADVVIATPGRLLDHIRRRTIRLDRVKTLVLDECDRLLDMGFIPDVETIIKHLPEKRQTLLYSATISFEVNRLAQKYMNDPVDVGAKSYVDPAKLKQVYYGPVDNSLKFSILAHLLNENREGLSMVFCNTRRYVDFVSKNLNKAGINTVSLHGGFSQHERSKRLKSFQDKRTRVLVATDVAARGLDIPGVTTVYNYDLPDNQKQYIHRVGRTARAGKAGKAVTIISQRDSEKFIGLYRESKIKISKVRTPKVNKIHTQTMTFRKKFRKRPERNFQRKSSNSSFSRYSV